MRDMDTYLRMISFGLNYEQYDWYKETIKPEDFSDSVFSDVEKRNVQALQKERDARSN